MPNDAEKNLAAILASPSYRPADRDPDLLQKPELRPVRLQLELYKPELSLEEHRVRSTIVLFGSANSWRRTRPKRASSEPNRRWPPSRTMQG